MIRTYTIVFILLYGTGMTGWAQHLPKVLGEQRSDVINARLSHQAALAFQKFPPPATRTDWELRKKELRKRITELSGAQTFPDLDPDYHETGQINIEGGVVKMIYFQTRPGVYATANLYVPEGEGPFPAVITMMGHSSNGKLYDMYRAVGHELVRNGYVSLHIDPWGAGERTTTHGNFEYHGAHLGAALLNVGETLLGMQLTDNMRGVDLLSSLPYVDASKIGATGASGGGNQTMWLTAMDDRIKAGMPVVSVGTFESYVMSSNCVCEMLPDGLMHMEESEVLGLVAPRAIRVCNAAKEANKAFIPQEMERSVKNAGKIFDLYGAGAKLDYQIGNTTHGYHPEYREFLIGWLDLHLKGKGDGSPQKTREYQLPEAEKMMVFEAGKRPEQVVNTIDFCAQSQTRLPGTVSENADTKRSQLRQILKISAVKKLAMVHQYDVMEGWDRYALETTDGYLIPVLIKEPAQAENEFMMIAHTEGKDSISPALLRELENSKNGLCLVDFWGIGESGSIVAQKLTGTHLPGFHTLSRSLIWLGYTLQGTWVREMEIVADWLKEEFGTQDIGLIANKDLGLTGMFYSALNPGQIKTYHLEDVPVSYAFDDKITDGFFTMSVHIPGFLNWGTVSMVGALSEDSIRISTPRRLDGTQIDDVDTFKKDCDRKRKEWQTSGRLEFVKPDKYKGR